MILSKLESSSGGESLSNMPPIPHLDDALVCPESLDGEGKILRLVLRGESVILLSLKMVLGGGEQSVGRRCSKWVK